MKQVISPLWLAEVQLPLSIIKEYENILSYPQGSESKKKKKPEKFGFFSRAIDQLIPKENDENSLTLDIGDTVQIQDTTAMSRHHSNVSLLTF